MNIEILRIAMEQKNALRNNHNFSVLHINWRHEMVYCITYVTSEST
ncbi:MAG: hypothetical protein K0R06_2583 [Clostridium sp.]|jgi:hypothetical protein|nr:hypothetical protein [Clostridium sp.]